MSFKNDGDKHITEQTLQKENWAEAMKTGKVLKLAPPFIGAKASAFYST